MCMSKNLTNNQTSSGMTCSLKQLINGNHQELNYIHQIEVCRSTKKILTDNLQSIKVLMKEALQCLVILPIRWVSVSWINQWTKRLKSDKL